MRKIAVNGAQTTTKPKYAGKMDEECIQICDAMNMVRGIRTVESCCGHGNDRFRVWFEASNLKALPPLLYWFDGCHCGHYGWRVIVKTDCAMSPVTFMLQGPVGETAYKEANHIANLLQKIMKGPLKIMARK